MKEKRKTSNAEKQCKDVSCIKALRANFIAIVLLRPQFIHTKKSDDDDEMKRTFMATKKPLFYANLIRARGDVGVRAEIFYPCIPSLRLFRVIVKKSKHKLLWCSATEKLLCNNTCSGLRINDLVISPSPSTFAMWCFIYLPPEVLSA